jgi:hypothetical protein
LQRFSGFFRAGQRPLSSFGSESAIIVRLICPNIHRSFTRISIMLLKNALCVLGLSGLAMGALSVALTSPADARKRHAHRQVYRQVAIAAPVDGLAASHDMRREGGRLCFSDHFHYGSSAGLPSQQAAQVAAAKSWSSFVDFEYGSTWANYGKASSKEMKCSQGGGSWGCDLGARPCR